MCCRKRAGCCSDQQKLATDWYEQDKEESDAVLKPVYRSSKHCSNFHSERSSSCGCDACTLRTELLLCSPLMQRYVKVRNSVAVLHACEHLIRRKVTHTLWRPQHAM
jgi:hypothetical protein